MKRKCIKFLSGWLFSIVFFPQAFAGVATPCGTNEANCWPCGDDCTARLDSGGKLSIYGSGEMRSYSNDNPTGYEVTTYGLGGWITSAPWRAKVGEITSVDVQGVTNVSTYAFLGMKNITSVNIGDSVISIGTSTFFDCGISDIYLPPSVTSVGLWGISNPNLTRVVSSIGTMTNQNGVPGNAYYKYEQEGDLIYLYDRNGNVKGIFASQSDLKDAILENGQARIEYGEDNSFTVYNKNGEIIGKWDSHGDVIARYVKGSDGSTSIYDKFGKLIGLQGKRILTVDEATALVKDNKNTFKLKYR